MFVELSGVSALVGHEVVEVDQAEVALARNDVALGEIWCVPAVEVEYAEEFQDFCSVNGRKGQRYLAAKRR